MAHIFGGTDCLTVYTYGPGRLSLFSKDNTSNGVVGYKETDRSGKTVWLIGFSHNFTQFAFMWDGEGEAVYRIWNHLLTQPVGTSWERASYIPWNATTVSSKDVADMVGKATNRDNNTTFWILPDSI